MGSRKVVLQHLYPLEVPSGGRTEELPLGKTHSSLSFLLCIWYPHIYYYILKFQSTILASVFSVGFSVRIGLWQWECKHTLGLWTKYAFVGNICSFRLVCFLCRCLSLLTVSVVNVFRPNSRLHCRKTPCQMVYINNYKHDVPSRRLSRDLIGLVKGHFLQRRGAHQPDAGCRIRSVDPLARCIPPSPPGTCFLIGHGPMALKKPWLQSPKSHWIWDSTQTL